jgi:two-component system response regulator HydG
VVRPVGATTETPVDVRIVTATNVDLERAVEQKRFRSDLFFRINVVHIELPPLRTRENDVILLAQHFLARIARDGGRRRYLSPAAAAKLLAYDWPGNVRELQNCIERAVALGRGEEIGVNDLPERIRTMSSQPPTPTDDPQTLLPLRDVERGYVRRVLRAVDGNKTIAARILGIDRKTLYRKLSDDP